jgi:CheY-like chemotaxis protein
MASRDISTHAAARLVEESLRVLIVDDSRFFRDAAKGLFQLIPRIGSVSTASSGKEALALLEDGAYDLMVLDLSMDGMGGLEVASRLRGAPNAPKIVMVSLYDEPEFRSAASSAGVAEFMNKPALAGDVEPLLDRLFGVAA